MKDNSDQIVRLLLQMVFPQITSGFWLPAPNLIFYRKIYVSLHLRENRPVDFPFYGR